MPEKMLIIEFVGPNLIGMSFQGFFSPSIKDKIKGLPSSRYDSINKIWTLKKEQKSELKNF